MIAAGASTAARASFPSAAETWIRLMIAAGASTAATGWAFLGSTSGPPHDCRRRVDCGSAASVEGKESIARLMIAAGASTAAAGSVRISSPWKPRLMIAAGASTAAPAGMATIRQAAGRLMIAAGASTAAFDDVFREWLDFAAS